MLGKKNGPQNFFDKEIFAKMIPEDHPLVKIKRNVSFAFVEEAVKELYDPEKRPAGFSAGDAFPGFVFGGLGESLGYSGLPGTQVQRFVPLVLCDIGWDEPVPDDTMLVVFRRRLGEKKFRELFMRVVEEAKKIEALRGQWAVVDGTKVVANAACRGVIVLRVKRRGKFTM